VDPSILVDYPPFLNAQDLVSDLMRNGTNERLVVQDCDSLPSVGYFLDPADDDGSSRSEALQELAFFVPFDHFLNVDPPLADLVLLFVPQEFLHRMGCTKMESRVTPGKMRSSSSGVTTSISPDLLSLKTKKMFEAPTSTICSL
jgi:hypothetical protein